MRRTLGLALLLAAGGHGAALGASVRRELPLPASCQRKGSKAKPCNLWDVCMHKGGAEHFGFPAAVRRRAEALDAAAYAEGLEVGDVYLDEDRAACLSEHRSRWNRETVARQFAALPLEVDGDRGGAAAAAAGAAAADQLAEAFAGAEDPSSRGRRLLGFLVAPKSKRQLLASLLNCSPWDRVAEFRDVWFDDSGCIASPSLCRFAMNGGCFSGFGACSTEVKMAMQEPSDRTAHPHVIGLNSRFRGMWHTVAESLVALAHMNTSGAAIHVTRDAFSVPFLQLLGVDESQIVEGAVFAKRLTVPEKAGCGCPSVDQIMWLRKLIREAAARPPEAALLITRRSSRQVANAEEVVEIVSGWASRKGLDFLHHDDSQLPPLRQQFAAFSRAKYIIGPQGAGSLFLVAAPWGATYVEYDMRCNQNLVYLRLATLLGFNYYGMRYKVGEDLDTGRLEGILEHLL